MNTIGLIGSVGRDLRYALRTLIRRPTFMFAAALTFALGSGATTAIFSVVYGVLIKPLPYPDAHELVSVRHMAPGLTADALGTADTMYVTYRELSRVFEHIGLWSTGEQTLTGLGEPERIVVLQVTQGTLDALGVRPALGRSFSEDEHGPAADGPDPVIVSHAFWQRRFGGDAAALGRTFTLDDRLLEIVGIMPASFRFLDLSPAPDVITATRIDESRLTLGNPNSAGLARLKDGVTLADANADVARMLPIWLDAWPARPRGLSREAVAEWELKPALRPLKDDVVGNVAATLWLLMGAVGVVLLIACANVANLLLVRADARRRELAVRAALGATRRRIAGELLRESIVLGAIGGAGGLALAHAGLDVLAAVAPPNLPRIEDVAIGPPVVAFSIAVSVIASFAFGSIAAFRRTFDSDALLGTDAYAAGASRQGNRTRNALIVVQVALAMVLLVGAGLMTRTFQALTAVDAGFADPEYVQLARTFIPPAVEREAERYTREQRAILERITALNGVTAAGFSSGVPLEGRMALGGIAVEDRVYAAGDPRAIRRFLLISPGYLRAVGTRLVAGRDLAWVDIDQPGKAALISENLARELWGEPQAGIGKRIRAPTDAPGDWREIVGVTQDVHNEGLNRPPPPLVYWPAEPQFELRGVNYVIRSNRAGTQSFVDEVRQAVSTGDVAVFQVRTLGDLYSDSLARTSFTLVMLAIAGGMALALGIIGIYGVIAYIVSQRIREVGIRSALGAEPRRLKKMFLLHGLALSAVGAAVGLVVATAAGRVMSSLLFGVGPLDPIAYVVALGVMLAAAALASYVPARRAAMIDPMETLRAE